MNAETLPLILIVDDSATDVFFLQTRLAAAGIANPVHRVEDGAEAIGWLERHFAEDAAEAPRMHLVFLDLNMPRMDGFAVLEWIQTHDLRDRFTVAVHTTSSEPEDRERAARLGAHAYLVKYPRVDEVRDVCTLAMQRAGVHA